MANQTPAQQQNAAANDFVANLLSRKLLTVGAAGGLAYLDKLTPTHICVIICAYLLVQGAVDVAEVLAHKK